MSQIFKAISNLLSDVKEQPVHIFPRLTNYISAYFKLPYLVPQPLEIQIEPSAVCNLKCLMCNLDKSHDKQRFLTPSNFENLLKNLKSVQSINFTGMGETLLNPHLETLIKMANDRNITVTMITNGQLLTPKKNMTLSTLHIRGILISMESGDPKMYEKYRLGAKFSILDKNLSNLSKQLLANHSKTLLYINVVLLPFNLNDLSHIYKIIDFGKLHRIKHIFFQLPNDFDRSGLKKYYLPDNTIIKYKFDLIQNYALSKSITVSLPSINIKPGSCYYPWVYPQITASGHLLPCCIIPQFDLYSKIIKNYSWGNVFDSSFNNVWNNNQAQQFRHDLKFDPNKHCRHCTKYRGIL
jgi:MoaA/NifB/PqqE/SkfB family radical SAM enzyme